MSKASLEDYDPLTNFTERTTFLKLQFIAQNIQTGGTIFFRKIGEGGKKITCLFKFA